MPERLAPPFSISFSSTLHLIQKRVLAEANDEGTDTTKGARPSKRPRVHSEEEEDEEEEEETEAAASADGDIAAVTNLLDLPDLVLFELCQWYPSLPL